MSKYLFRVLGPEESKSNQIKTITGETPDLFEYLTRGTSYSNSVISMTALLDYALAYVNQNANRMTTKIAVIDKSKLDSSKVFDVSSISRLVSTRRIGEMSAFPPHFDDNSFREKYLHWSSCNIEFLYLDNIPHDAYKTFFVDELEWIYGCVYNKTKVLADHYPSVLGEVFSTSNIHEFNELYARNGNSNYEANRIYLHAIHMYKYGLLQGFEALYEALFYRVKEVYLPNQGGVDKLKYIANKLDESKTLTYRGNIDKVLKLVMDDKINVAHMIEKYKDHPMKDIYRYAMDDFKTTGWLAEGR